MSIIKEFKEFAIKGNVIDLAVGIIIGNAFGKIISSLVQDIMMPILGKIIGNINLSQLSIVLAEAKLEGGKEMSPPVVLHLGMFLSAIVDFTFIAFAIFLVIRLINKVNFSVK